MTKKVFNEHDITGVGVTQSAHMQQNLGEAYVSQRVAVIRMKERGHAPWILLQLPAKANAREQHEAQIYGDKPVLNLANIRELEIPLSPLTGQRRIVATVDELMAVLDQLEAARAIGEKLFTAMIARLNAA